MKTTKLLLMCFLMGILLLFPYQAQAGISNWDPISKENDTLTLTYHYVFKGGKFEMTSMDFTSRDNKKYDVVLRGKTYPMNESIPAKEELESLEDDTAEIIDEKVFPISYKRNDSYNLGETYVAEKNSKENKIIYYGLHRIKKWIPVPMINVQEGTESSTGEVFELYRMDVGNLPAEQPEEKPSESIMDDMTGIVPELKSISIVGSSKVAPFSSIKLSVKPNPMEALIGDVKYKSSNTKYATVSSNGLVKAKKAGAGKTVTITATVDGKKATKKIAINGLVKKITIKGKSSIKVGKKMKLKAAIKTNGKNANKKLTWKVNNNKYASVTSTGLLKTKKAGKGKTIKVTATSTDGSKVKATKKIKIK